MLIWRTGQNEGAAYNALGTNLTETPQGHDNFTVGSFYYDFSGLTDNGTLYTSELAVIIADGTKIAPETDQDTDDGFDSIDDDEEGPDQEDDAGIIRPDTLNTITQVSFNIRLGCPSYSDASVFTSKFEVNDGATNAYIDGVDSTLAAWLDAQVTPVWEEADIVDTVRVWWQFRAFLRWSLHWALYKVKITNPASESVSDDIAQSNIGPGTMGPVDAEMHNAENHMPVGPAALLRNYSANSIQDSSNPIEWPETTWVRLWDEELPISYIRRGDIAGLPYCIITPPDAIGPDVPVDPDLLITLEDDIQLDSQGAREEGPDSHAFGKEVVVRHTLRNLNVRVADDEMLVLHIQSGRARLKRPEVATSGGLDIYAPGLIIAGTDLPARGPKFTVHHASVHARARYRYDRR